MNQNVNISNYSYRPPWYFYFFNIFIGINPILLQSLSKVGAENGYNIFTIMFENSPKAGWVFLAVFIAFSLYALAVFYVSLKPNRSIIITNDTISAPKSLLSSKICSVKIADISSVNPASWLHNYLLIKHPNGKLKISRLGYSGTTTLDNIYFSLNSSLRANMIQA